MTLSSLGNDTMISTVKIMKFIAIFTTIHTPVEFEFITKGIKRSMYQARQKRCLNRH